MGPPASDRVTRVRSYSGATLRLPSFAYGDFTLCVLTFQSCSAKLPAALWWSSTPIASYRFGLFPVRSPLLGKSMFLSLPTGT